MKILVLEVPHLHLGYTGCYGNDWVATPNLDRLAAQGIVFERHYADRVDGLGARTGRYAVPGSGDDGIDHIKPLFESLIATGIGWKMHRSDDWASLASKCKSLLQKMPAQGLVWIETPSLAPPWDLPADLLDVYCEEDEEPWLDPPLSVDAANSPQDLLRLQNTYAAVVTFFDAQLGNLLETLDIRQRKLLLIVTASSGLSLGEHGIVGTGWSRLHGELTHLPLLFRLPDGSDAGLRIDALTQTIDLLPTILDVWQVNTAGLQGHSLWPLVRGETDAVRKFALSLDRNQDGTEWAWRTREWTLLGNDRNELQLFAEPEDLWETNDLKQPNPEALETLERECNEKLASLREPQSPTG